MRSIYLLGFALIAMAMDPGVGTAAVCRPSDARTMRLKLDVGRYSSATAGGDKIVRDSLHLPLVPTNQITVVSQETTCKKANTALQSYFANTGNNMFSGQVYVLQVGTAYAVVDPAYLHDASAVVGPILFLDSRFKPLGTTL